MGLPTYYYSKQIGLNFQYKSFSSSHFSATSSYKSPLWTSSCELKKTLTPCHYLKVHMYGLKLISKKKLHRLDNVLIYRTIDKSTGALMTSQVFFIICSAIRLVKVYAVCRHFEKSPVIQHCQATKVTRRPLFTKAHLSSLLRTFV